MSTGNARSGEGSHCPTSQPQTVPGFTCKVLWATVRLEPKLTNAAIRIREAVIRSMQILVDQRMHLHTTIQTVLRFVRNATTGLTVDFVDAIRLCRFCYNLSGSK